MPASFNATPPASGGASVDSEVVPPNERRRVDAVFGIFTADVTVINRNIVVEVVDVGGAVIGSVASPTSITASDVVSFSFAPGLPESAKNDNTITHPIPRFVLLPGQKIRVRNIGGTPPAGDAIVFRIDYETHAQ